MEPARVDGMPTLLRKHSAVDRHGALRQDPIDGVIWRSTRPVPHEDGTLAEVAKSEWPELVDPIVQVHVTTTLPGRVRAWGLHQRSTDRLFVVSGLISIGVYDGRLDSHTHGCFNEFRTGDRNPGLLVIPPDLYHGWKVIGDSEAFIINMPSVIYDYDAPDALDLPYDDPEAPQIVPFRW